MALYPEVLPCQPGYQVSHHFCSLQNSIGSPKQMSPGMSTSAWACWAWRGGVLSGRKRSAAWDVANMHPVSYCFRYTTSVNIWIWIRSRSAALSCMSWHTRWRGGITGVSGTTVLGMISAMPWGSGMKSPAPVLRILRLRGMQAAASDTFYIISERGRFLGGIPGIHRAQPNVSGKYTSKDGKRKRWGSWGYGLPIRRKWGTVMELDSVPVNPATFPIMPRLFFRRKCVRLRGR